MCEGVGGGGRVCGDACVRVRVCGGRVCGDACVRV